MIEQKKTLEEQRLDSWLDSAPRLAPSRDFTAQVMHRIEHRRAAPSWRKRLLDYLFAPHTMRWNFAGMAAAFSMVIAVVLGLQMLPQVEPTAPVAANAAAPVAANTVSVRFELYAPQAQQVALAGNFNNWLPRIPLRQRTDGRWIAEVQLPPGSYEYAFVLNGQDWVADPRAVVYRDDGFGTKNAVRIVTL